MSEVKEAVGMLDELLSQSRAAELVEEGGHDFIVTHQDMCVQSLHSLLDRPPRYIKQSLTMHTPLAFASYVNDHQIPGETAVFCDMENNRITAVIDYHARPQIDTSARRCAHRVSVGLQKSDYWLEWHRMGGEWAPQITIARFLMHRSRDVIAAEPVDGAPTPSGAELLTLAHHLEGRQVGKWTRQEITHSSSSVIHYEQKNEAHTPGSIEFPARFFINIPVFRGGNVQTLEMGFAFKITPEALLMKFEMMDTTTIMQNAFDQAMSDAIETLGEGIPVYDGVAP